MITTIFDGALGGTTFGIYHQYITNKIIENNNNILNKEIDLLKNSNISKEIDLLKLEIRTYRNK